MGGKGDLFQRILTSVDFALLHVLARHGVRLDDFGQRISLEVLLTRLFLGVVLPRILFHAFHVVCPPAKFVLPPFEELEALLAHINHPVGGVAKHLDDSGNLVVL